MVKKDEVDEVRCQIRTKVDRFLQQVIFPSISEEENSDGQASTDSAGLDSPLSNSLVKERRNMSKIAEYHKTEDKVVQQRTTLVQHPQQDKDVTPLHGGFSIKPQPTEHDDYYQYKAFEYYRKKTTLKGGLRPLKRH